MSLTDRSHRLSLPFLHSKTCRPCRPNVSTRHLSGDSSSEPRVPTAVYLFKKALFLAHSLSLRFPPGSTIKDLPAVPSTSDIPVFVDNVLPSLLLHYGILSTSACQEADLVALSAAFSAGAPKSDVSAPSDPPLEGPLLSTRCAYAIRGAALTACAQIVEAAHALATSSPETYGWMSSVNEVGLDGFIWSIAKEGELRSIGRIRESGGSVFY